MASVPRHGWPSLIFLIPSATLTPMPTNGPVKSMTNCLKDSTSSADLLESRNHIPFIDTRFAISPPRISDTAPLLKIRAAFDPNISARLFFALLTKS